MVAELVNPLDRGLEPEPKVFRFTKRFARRRDHTNRRLGQAQSPRVKFEIAVDHFRATAKDDAVDREKADTAYEQLMWTLIHAAEALEKTIRRHR